jgi:hypothetical protein
MEACVYASLLQINAALSFFLKPDRTKHISVLLKNNVSYQTKTGTSGSVLLENTTGNKNCLSNIPDKHFAKL